MVGGHVVGSRPIIFLLCGDGWGMILKTNSVIIAYVSVVFFIFLFFQFCDVVTLVIIHKEILAMFGYRLTF